MMSGKKIDDSASKQSKGAATPADEMDMTAIVTSAVVHLHANHHLPSILHQPNVQSATNVNGDKHVSFDQKNIDETIAKANSIILNFTPEPGTPYSITDGETVVNDGTCNDIDEEFKKARQKIYRDEYTRAQRVYLEQQAEEAAERSSEDSAKACQPNVKVSVIVKKADNKNKPNH